MSSLQFEIYRTVLQGRLQSEFLSIVGTLWLRLSLHDLAFGEKEERVEWFLSPLGLQGQNNIQRVAYKN